MLMLGAVLVLGTLFFWWRDVVKESRTPGMHTPVVRLGLRYGMMFFITSEVMFFVAFFWAFFNFALFPETQGNGQTVWPPTTIHTFDPFHVPILNTMILLLSGTTVTWAHHCLLERDKKGLVWGLGLTVLLGLSFTMCQAIEYSDAPFKFYGGGVYPSTFFLATGFHGFHVIVGTCFLLVCWFRARAGQFTPERHFGFEAAAWYWHFVDVVWLFLFACIYWWGASPVLASH
jgi:cytochrome c oxidase subunit 3